MFSMSDIVYTYQDPRHTTGMEWMGLYYWHCSRWMWSVEFFISKVLISTPNLRNEFLDVVQLKTESTVMTWYSFSRWRLVAPAPRLGCGGCWHFREWRRSAWCSLALALAHGGGWADYRFCYIYIRARNEPSRRRPLLGPSPGWKRFLVLSHLRY